MGAQPYGELSEDPLAAPGPDSDLLLTLRESISEPSLGACLFAAGSTAHILLATLALMRPHVLFVSFLLFACGGEMSNTSSQAGASGVAGASGAAGGAVPKFDCSAGDDPPGSLDGVACSDEGQECGHCRAPQGALYVCQGGQWERHYAGSCDDSLPGHGGQLGAGGFTEPGSGGTAGAAGAKGPDGGTAGAAGDAVSLGGAGGFSGTPGLGGSAGLAGAAGSAQVFDCSESSQPPFPLHGFACTGEGQECGHCSAPPAPLYVCHDGMWQGVGVVNCEDGMPNQGGAAGTGGAAGCDPDQYSAGNPCSAGDRCQDGNTVWRCEGSKLRSYERVLTAALPDDCTPVGTWRLEAGTPTASSPFGCNPAGPQLPMSVTLALDIDGVLLSDLGGVFTTADCRLQVTHNQSFSNPSETWSEHWTVDISFVASGASGTYQRSGGGFCTGSDEGPLLVTKQP